MSLKQVARETLAILESGSYSSPSGAPVELGAALAAAVAGSRVYTPTELAALAAGPSPRGPAAELSLLDATTQAALVSLAEEDEGARLGLLNFASARNPGGGFLSGAKAQEEDLTRCSGLYPCLSASTVRPYYTFNRGRKTMLYSDHMIASPQVPFFRASSRRSKPGWLLERPVLADVVTAPAPNAGQARRRQRGGGEIEAALRQRAGYVLALAEELGVESLVLGAWGCGVFRNDPALVADAFLSWLESPRYRSAFRRVVFAIPRRVERNHQAFAARLGLARAR